MMHIYMCYEYTIGSVVNSSAITTCVFNSLNYTAKLALVAIRFQNGCHGRQV